MKSTNPAPNHYKSLHLEPTTRCVLACPACPRTTWQDMLKRPVSKVDLDVDKLEKFLDCQSGQQINRFILCGDYGDCIYYPDLFKLIQKFRDRVSFMLITNGSHRSKQFWHDLASALNQNDKVVFAIDGLENTNHLYRVNSDWNSIMLGLDIMVQSPVQVHWKTIVFQFNYTELEKIKTFAENKGATFHAEKTHRFGSDALRPPVNFVETNHLFQPDFAVNHDIEIEPRCEKDAMVITADGYLSPCDWIRNPQTFYKSQIWKQKERWLDQLKIENNTLDQALLIIRDWENYVRHQSLNASDTVDVLCKMLCRKNCVADNKIYFGNG